jgi:hypothetical protein
MKPILPSMYFSILKNLLIFGPVFGEQINHYSHAWYHAQLAMKFATLEVLRPSLNIEPRDNGNRDKDKKKKQLSGRHDRGRGLFESNNNSPLVVLFHFLVLSYL